MGISTQIVSRIVTEGARYLTGHFLHMILFLTILLLQTGCSSDDGSSGQRQNISLPETGETAMLIKFAASTDDSMPEAVADLMMTAGGRFFASESSESDFFSGIAQELDRTGNLLILVLPEEASFSGFRDHLVIWTDTAGIPVRMEPQLNSELLSDSLWENPVLRQQTILELVNFFKPDVILQIVPEDQYCAEITEFWSENGSDNDLTVALYTPPIPENNFRGWGVFTGRGIRNRLLEGMDIHGFFATVRLISGINWGNPESGYPAMQAFYTTETE